MNKEVIIRKGYTARVTTWENDADNYNTADVWVGLDRKTAQEYIEFFRLFYSKNYSNNCIGNIYQPSEDQRIKINEILSHFIETHKLFVANEGYFNNSDFYCNSTEDFIDCLSEFLIADSGLNGSDYYFRVFDRAQLIYSPEDIILEVEEIL